MFYRMTGSPAAPTVLFVHGYGCAHDDWDHQVAALRPHAGCIAVDLPGHGLSPPNAAPDLPAIAAAIEALRESLGCGRVILVGHSMGAKIVREIHAANPAAVAGIVMIDGSFYDGDRVELMARARDKVERGSFADFAAGLFADMVPEGEDSPLARHLRQRAATLDPDFGRRLFLATVGWDPERGRQSLEAIRCPALLIQSTRFDADFVRRTIPAGGSSAFVELVRRCVPQAEIEIVPDAGHFPMLTRAEAVNRRLIDFVRRCAAT